MTGKRLARMGLAFVGILALSLTVSCKFFNSDERRAPSDDDRPPVIVSGGSIDVHAEDYHTTNPDDGSWVPDSATVWSHEHMGNAPVTFEVAVNKPSCTDFPILGDKVFIDGTYAGSKNTIKIEIKVHKKDPRFTINFGHAVDVKNGNGHVLLSLADWTLSEVRVGGKKCPLDQSAIVTVCQLQSNTMSACPPAPK